MFDFMGSALGLFCRSLLSHATHSIVPACRPSSSLLAFLPLSLAPWIVSSDSRPALRKDEQMPPLRLNESTDQNIQYRVGYGHVTLKELRIDLWSRTLIRKNFSTTKPRFPDSILWAKKFIPVWNHLLRLSAEGCRDFLMTMDDNYLWILSCAWNRRSILQNGRDKFSMIKASQRRSRCCGGELIALQRMDINWAAPIKVLFTDPVHWSSEMNWCQDTWRKSQKLKSRAPLFEFKCDRRKWAAHTIAGFSDHLSWCGEMNWC
jgi:hypothetical protein